MRPKQWMKNSLLFVGIFFSRNIFNTQLLIKSIFAFILFCLLSGTIYLINDITDIERDTHHPVKKKRPIASGRLSSRAGILVSAGLCCSVIPLTFFLDFQFGLVAICYLGLNVLYSLVLKHIVILDVIVVTIGFILRAIAGAVVVGVEISSWLLICTTFLALFLVLSKRRNELLLLKNNSIDHRKILTEYSQHLLDQMIGAVTASAMMSYALYTTSQETVAKFGTRNLIFTLPFVLYGVFRYLYLIYQKDYGGSPELIFMKDSSMIINVALFCVVALIVIYL
jgi:4-hydroxybenzoate polyprenyltransferase